jgi:hypothetical protein
MTDQYDEIRMGEGGIQIVPRTSLRQYGAQSPENAVINTTPAVSDFRSMEVQEIPLTFNARSPISFDDFIRPS